MSFPLVNAHTHSEWNASKNLGYGDGMIPWIRRVLSYQSRDQEPASPETTISTMAKQGITHLADHTANSRRPIPSSIRILRYREFLRDQLPEGFSSLSGDEGLAPHSLHTVFPSVWETLSGLPEDVPLSVHAGESKEERELFETGSGPLAELLLERNYPSDQITFLKGRTPCSILNQYGLLRPTTLIVHGMHLFERDYHLIAESGATLCLCPLSNRSIGTAFGSGSASRRHTVERLRLIDRLDLSLAVGTDSLLSSPSLSLAANGELLLEFGLDREKLERAFRNVSFFPSAEIE
ncbi:MAG: hypothetical protein D6679_09860 [Candidatus Hydrogenedentota bacterium]|nr:MAG: hypothetical protein D6679_09860 [Candidatus Hydrogenedentota bacterium]